jgi:hypothetical protein
MRPISRPKAHDDETTFFLRPGVAKSKAYIYMLVGICPAKAASPKSWSLPTCYPHQPKPSRDPGQACKPTLPAIAAQ